MVRRIVKTPRRVSAELTVPGEPPESRALATRMFFSDFALNLPADLTLEQYTSLAPHFNRAARCLLWWIGDYLNYGEQHFGEESQNVIDSLGYGRKTLESCRWMSRAIPPKERRSELTWNHHMVVAKMNRHDRKFWLDRAIEKRLSTRELRAAIVKDRKERAAGRRSGPSKRLDRFDDEALLVATIETDKEFFDALQEAKMQWDDRRMFDHQALREKAEPLYERLGQLLQKLVRAKGKSFSPNPPASVRIRSQAPTPVHQLYV